MKTSPIEVSLIGVFGNDLSVVNAARVSMNKLSTSLSEKDTKLLTYLVEHKHTSPFNHAFCSFRVKAPIFVARQLVKHKFMPWNEVSRRYVDEEPEFYMPAEWREKADNVKQGSSSKRCEKVYNSRESEDWFEEPSLEEFFHYNVNDCLFLYNNLLKAGVCPEQARMVLPLNTMTEWVWSGTLGAFIDMLRLRLDSHTQLETRVVAQKIYSILHVYFPSSFSASFKDLK